MWHMNDGWGLWLLFGAIWIAAVLTLIVWGMTALVLPRVREAARDETLSPHQSPERPDADDELTDEQLAQVRRRLQNPAGN